MTLFMCIYIYDIYYQGEDKYWCDHSTENESILYASKMLISLAMFLS